MLFKVLGRNFILFILIWQEPRLQERPVVFYLFLVWGAVELVRYPYYMLQSAGKGLHLPGIFASLGHGEAGLLPMLQRTGKCFDLPVSFTWFLDLYPFLVWSEWSWSSTTATWCRTQVRDWTWSCLVWVSEGEANPLPWLNAAKSR